VRDPFDPENPYRDRYEQWDYWCYMNARDPYSDEMVRWYNGDSNADWFFADIGVDSQGFMVPYEDYYTERMEWSIGNYSPDEGTDCAASLTCAGPIEPRLRDELTTLTARIRAAYVLPVPEWLAAAPPLAAKYLPDGRFVLLGEPGCGENVTPSAAEYRGAPAMPDACWCLYSAEGELLDSGQPGEEWWQLFVKDYCELLGLDSTENLTTWEYNGMITVYNYQNQEYSGTFTYDGTVLEGEWYEQPKTYDPRAFATLSGAEIPLIYAAQQYVEPREPVLPAQP